MHIVLLLMLFAVPAFAGEDCAQLGGRCSDKCVSDEVSEVGAFLDCTDRQECCVKKPVPVKEAVLPEPVKSKNSTNEK